jgi:hypothetical protein
MRDYCKCSAKDNKCEQQLRTIRTQLPSPFIGVDLIDDLIEYKSIKHLRLKNFGEITYFVITQSRHHHSVV